jgi:uncharacterized protein YecE (DUF72 family)
MTKLMIGTAGWSIARAMAHAFDADGSGLERYASVFSGVEINSSFYRPHRKDTYARWAASVPADFRFSVKCPKVITHTARLVDARDELARFLDEISALDDRLGPILVQLPPSLKFDAARVRNFFELACSLHRGAWVCEPRHGSWFEPEAVALLTEYCIARVAADPGIVEAAGEPACSRTLAYWRLHGSPEIYYSPYSAECLEAMAEKLVGWEAQEAWCIFDNTAAGAALENALTLREMVEARRRASAPEAA